MKQLASIAGLLVLWAVASAAADSSLLPSPAAVAVDGSRLLLDSDCWRHIAISLWRGAVGLGLALLFGVLVGVPCGLKRSLWDVFAPFASAVQGCPTIVWITLVMVWAGVGAAVPISAVFVAVFPAIFLNTAQGVAALDRRLLKMARLYHVPRRRILVQILLPGISPHLIAGFSFAAGICWKVISMAEFIGAESGIGTQIYWAYRNLDIPRLFAWALLVILLSLALDVWLLKPLQQRAAHRQEAFRA